MKPVITKILFVALILAMMLLAASATTVSDILSYDDAIERLGSISLTDTEELALIFSSLEAVGSRFYAPQYLYLTRALLDLSGGEDIDFDRIEIALTILKNNGSFIQSYTADESLSYLPLDSLLTYVHARKLEKEGKHEEAYQTYASCQILDSIDRAIAVKIALNETADDTPDEGVDAITALQVEYEAHIADLEAQLADAQAQTQAAQAELNAQRGTLLLKEGELSLTETKLAFVEDKLANTETALADALMKIDEMNAAIAELEAALAAE